MCFCVFVTSLRLRLLRDEFAGGGTPREDSEDVLSEIGSFFTLLEWAVLDDGLQGLVSAS